MKLKGALWALALLAAANLSFASSLEKLVETLRQKGVLTEEEARKILEEARAEELRGEELERLKALASVRLDGVAFLHYDYAITAVDKNDDDLSEFVVTRAYFNVRKGFEDGSCFRLTTDVYRDPALDQGYKVRLKYAYFDWRINENLSSEVGLGRRPAIDWLQRVLWRHRYLEKTFLEDRDGANLMNSADLGVSLKGNFENWQFFVGVYNGEGYKQVAEKDHHFGKSVEARVNWSPTPGLTLALHAAFIDNDNYWAGNTTLQVDRLVVQPILVYENDYFLLGFQYFFNRDSDYYANATSPALDFNNRGWSVNADLKLERLANLPLVFFARYGEWNYDDDWTALHPTELGAYDRSQLMVGLEHRFNRHLRLGAAYKQVDYDLNAEQKALVGVDRSYKQTAMVALEVAW
ncbi:MAG: hypothetical protein GXO08_03310 [Aquificae bacterium]|nr:hypothetical protein [Aquificota bacterium]